ncbi:MAG: 2-amino-4-hydroxy-6-hydroxymethyldihydropteridine diphosphokinase [Elusimicrobia bacterium]|nr:2-amino-4-hydroxy-6-hydroxymethyldihydropteridine diphosphokinase [Elusimicrobiota bacterium]
MRRAAVRAWLSLGSNLGRPRERLAWALRELDRLPSTRLVRASRVLRSSPVGAPGQPDFLNRCALVATRLSPMGLLAELKRLEGVAGRRPGPRWGPRPLDIDIVFYGRERIASRLLRVPHPRAAERRFVLEGLAELSPGFRPPWRPRRPLGAWLARLNDPSQNVNVYRRSRRHGQAR